MRRSPSVAPAIRVGFALLVTVAGTLLVTGCDEPPLAPPAQPEQPAAHAAPRVLGLMAVTFSGIGTNAMRASVRPVGGALGGPSGTTADGVHLALTTVPGSDGSVQLELISTGSFTEGVRGSGGVRYLYATFKVRNAAVDGTPYSDARSNLTFLGASATSSINGTPFTELRRYDGSASDPAIATQILPTGAVHRTLDGTLASEGPDVLQVLTETEAASFTAPPDATSIFPYGFVVRNPGTPDSRTLPASPADGQFDGVVTFAYKIPLQASAADDPFTVTALFVAVDDDQTRVTQSLEEQDSTAEAAFAARATALGASEVTLLPGGGYQGAIPSRLLCTPVRTAGLAGGATATLFPDPPAFVAFAPDPYTGAGRVLASPTTLAATFDSPVLEADSASFVVTGSQSGGHFGGETYGGVGTQTVTTPSATFLPGELVDVTLTKALGLCEPPRVARYRVAASGGSGSFTSTVIPGVGSQPESVAAADLDGDGDVDLVTANSLADNVSILRNDGGNVFTSIGTPAAGNDPISIVAADLDGDGDVDLATANWASNQVTTLRNDGTGVFTTIGTVAVGANPTFLTAGDLDGDGDVDLAVANKNSVNVSILGNDGMGSFTNVGTVVVPFNPTSVVAADLNGDGDLDLAVADPGSPDVSVLENDGTGAFAEIAGPTVNGDARYIAAADLDGDGDVDLATADGPSGAVSILANDGSGAFDVSSAVTVQTAGEETEFITAADLDGDGDVDLATVLVRPTTPPPNSVATLWNNGTGAFTVDASAATIESNPERLIAADLDSDGGVDLAVVHLNGTLVILTNQ